MSAQGGTGLWTAQQQQKLSLTMARGLKQMMLKVPSIQNQPMILGTQNYVNKCMWNIIFLYYLYICMFTCPVCTIKFSEFLLEVATKDKS